MSDEAPQAFRYAYDPKHFDPVGRIEANERVTSFQFEALNKRLDRIDEMMTRLERRLWLTVYGVVAAILAQGFQSLMAVAP